MIRYHFSLQVAFAVKAQMDILVKEEHEDLIRLEAFSNCREQGLHIIGPSGRASFAEQRNTDQIVIYPGQSKDFEITTNLPNDDDSPAWQNRKCFNYNEHRKAAAWLLSYVTGETYRD